ncbi:hypothetical protein OUZ56_012370 [Daphnia magna]|uniref:Uncharacterized protein n=1 Tax=Daphnia magna TaxID=35525 RepID=A0ABQ9Z432_9CRUS|nr:hypothetical protein OUZ56_012370 [Daphnia magna]
MFPRQRPYTFEEHQKMRPCSAVPMEDQENRRVPRTSQVWGTTSSTTTPSRPYQPLPPGVDIDEKLAFYETGYYNVAIRYLPRKDAVAVTNLQVNADYAKYLEPLKPEDQRQPIVVVEEQQIYHHIPLPSGPLVHPTPTPAPRLLPPPLRSLCPARYRELQPPQEHQVRTVIISNIFAAKAGVPEEDKKNVKVAIEDRAEGQVVTVKKEEEEEFVLQVLESEF